MTDIRPILLNEEENFSYKFTVCTLVTDHKQYRGMLDSFAQAGFGYEDCEYIYFDNERSNCMDAYAAINRFLKVAQGEYIIICHQDVLINFDDRVKLETQISKISEMDANWAILGNAGINDMYMRSMVITHNDGRLIRSGILPSRVQSLDENFLLVKAASNIGVSNDLKGFHMYGADICMIAEAQGYSSYAIDFHLTHLGRGAMDPSFGQISEAFYSKYSRFFRSRYIRTTMTSGFLSSNRIYRAFMDLRFVKNLVRFIQKIRFLILLTLFITKDIQSHVENLRDLVFIEERSFTYVRLFNIIGEALS